MNPSTARSSSRSILEVSAPAVSDLTHPDRGPSRAVAHGAVFSSRIGASRSLVRGENVEARVALPRGGRTSPGCCSLVRFAASILKCPVNRGSHKPRDDHSSTNGSTGRATTTASTTRSDSCFVDSRGAVPNPRCYSGHTLSVMEQVLREVVMRQAQVACSGTVTTAARLDPVAHVHVTLGRRCIPSRGVAPLSNTACMLPPRAWPDGHIDTRDVTRTCATRY